MDENERRKQVERIEQEKSKISSVIEKIKILKQSYIAKVD